MSNSQGPKSSHLSEKHDSYKYDHRWDKDSYCQFNYGYYPWNRCYPSYCFPFYPSCYQPCYTPGYCCECARNRARSSARRRRRSAARSLASTARRPAIRPAPSTAAIIASRATMAATGGRNATIATRTAITASMTTSSSGPRTTRRFRPKTTTPTVRQQTTQQHESRRRRSQGQRGNRPDGQAGQSHGRDVERFARLATVNQRRLAESLDVLDQPAHVLRDRAGSISRLRSTPRIGGLN